MIEFKNLTKKFGEQTILDSISYVFPSNGLVSICGESGCGKSTLLNILSTIEENYSGEVKFKDINISNLKNKEKRNLRANEFGYIFQSFNLLENDTVENNLALVLNSNHNLSNNFKNQKISEILDELEISYLRYNVVSKLSGGEKQRVAIGRAIINNPKVIFCDEPTGSLDVINSEKIFQLLRILSQECLVICVTHDTTLAKKYSDRILQLEKGKITEILIEKPAKHEYSLKIIKEQKVNFRPTISIKFALKHFFNKAKNKKIRFSISSILVSFCLICLGLALLVSSSISSSLKASFSSIIGENTLVLSRKDEDSELLYYESAKIDVLQNIVRDYGDDVDYIGCNYLIDFESYFRDRNSLYNVTKYPSQIITGITARHFNEFTYVKDFTNQEIYPLFNDTLEDDEIVLGLNFTQVKNICLNLQIVRTYESLGRFIENNELLVCIYLVNSYWSYSDEITFKVKGIIPTTRPCIYHTNNFFNESFFEDTLRFPSSLDLLKEEEFPWIMKKIYYFKTKEFQSYLINKLIYDKKYKNMVFDSDNKDYSPQTCSEEGSYTNKVYVYETVVKGIDITLIDSIIKNVPEIKSYYFSTIGGYINYGSSLLCGFANPIYLTKSKEDADKIIDSFTIIKNEEKDSIVVPNYAIEGYALNSSEKTLRFSTLKDGIVSGNYPLKVNEIAISKGVIDYLGGENLLNKDIYLTLNDRVDYFDDYMRKSFKTIQLKVVGVVLDDLGLNIYHDENYSLALFRDLFKINGFYMIPSSIIFITDSDIKDERIDKINKYLSEYKLTNPMSTINNSINEVLLYLEIILFCFSLITALSSIVVLIIISYVNLKENKKEIAILSLLGFSTFEIVKVSFIDVVFILLSAIFSSIISVIFLSVFLNKIIAKEVGFAGFYNFPLEAIGAILACVTLILFISLVFIIQPIYKFKISSNLH